MDMHRYHDDFEFWRIYHKQRQASKPRGTRCVAKYNGINPSSLIYNKRPEKSPKCCSKPLMYITNPKRLQTAALHH